MSLALRLLRKKKKTIRAPSTTIPPTTPAGKKKMRHHGRSHARDDRYTPPAMTAMLGLWLPPIPPTGVEEEYGDPPVPVIDMGKSVPTGKLVLETEMVGGLVGVASGSFPAAWASVRLNPGFYAHIR